MADGFTLEIDEDLARTLEKRAAEAGMSREAYAKYALAQEAFRYDDYTWRNCDPRQLDAVEPEGADRPWDEVKAALVARLEAGLAKRG